MSQNTNCLAGWKCTGCGEADKFIVEAKVLVPVTDDGTDFPVGDIEWEDSAYARCADCGKEATVKEFTKGGKDA